MTEKLIEEALQLIRDLEAAKAETDNPILIEKYNEDIDRIQALLDTFNDTLNELTERKCTI